MINGKDSSIIIGGIGSYTPPQILNALDRHGNTAATSIPLALDEAFTEGKIKSGNYIMRTRSLSELV